MSDALDLMARGRDHATDIASRLLGEPNKRLSRGREWRWGRNGSLSMALSGAHCGKWRDHETQEHGDILDLIERELRVSRSEAVRWLSDYFGGAPLKPIDRTQQRIEIEKAEKADDEARQAKRDLARRFWSEAVPIQATLAERYLRHRLGGRDVPADVLAAGSLRCHPKPLFGRESFDNLGGALVARMIDPLTGEGTGIHRTFLDNDGRKIDRRMLGAAGVVCLNGFEDVTHGVGICEGIENGLAVITEYEWRPIWAALSAGAVRTFPLLPGVDALTVFADSDESGTGQSAAEAVCQRWADAGCEARTFLPPVIGSDFGDMAQGRAA